MEKQRWEESERREEERRSEKRKWEERRCRCAKRKESGDSLCFFEWFVAPAGRKKAAGAEPAGQMRDDKSHAVVERSTFPSQQCEKVTVSDHFWKLTLQLQLQLHYTTLHPAISSSCRIDQVTTATIVTTAKNTTRTTFRSISGFDLPSMHHNNQPLLGFLFWNFRHRLVQYYW